MERRRSLFPAVLLAALALTAAVAGQEVLEDCDDVDEEFPALVPRDPNSSPPTEDRFGFQTAVPGQACAFVGRLECGAELYCEVTTQACQQRLPVGAACDPGLAVQPCYAPRPEGATGFDIPQRPGAVCAAQANGGGKCVPIAATGDSCADPAVSGCASPELCDAGICIERTFGSSKGRLATCTNDAECGGGREVCRPALDGRKRCLFEQAVGGPCLGAVGRVSTAACPAGTACDGRSNLCLTEGATLAIGENCSSDSERQLVLCDSGDSSTQAFCPLVEDENFQTLQSQCELDIVGKACAGDGDCVSGGTKGFRCDFGVCAKIPLGGSGTGHLGSCGGQGCSIYSGRSGLISRCELADDGVQRCLQERQIGDSCARVGSLIRDFVCAKNTRCHGPSQTCVRDVPAVGVGQPCGTTAEVQFVACVEGTSCGTQKNSDGFRLCQ